jgi:serine protease Do
MEEDSQIKTHFILGMSVAAIVGGLTGGIVSLLISSTIGIEPFLKLHFPELSNPNSSIVSMMEEENATIKVVEAVTPAVASVVVKKERGDVYASSKQYGSFFYNPYLTDEILSDEDSKEFIEVSSGTAFFVTEDGYLLTNKHVVSMVDAKFFVVTNDGEEIEAKFVDSDPFLDIAILKVEGNGFPTTVLGDSNNIKIGQTVIAIGNTLSEFRNTVTKGVISGRDRKLTAGVSTSSTAVIEQAIQTDAAINPGNSGGPLINLLGEVIGINTAVSISGESVGFAIPINVAKRAVRDIKEFGKIVRPWLGIRYAIVTPKKGDDQTALFKVGALITSDKGQAENDSIFIGSPAEKAGLKDQDIIVAINEKEISEKVSLAEMLAIFRPGDEITITYLRGEEKRDAVVTLEEFKSENIK